MEGLIGCLQKFLRSSHFFLISVVVLILSVFVFNETIHESPTVLLILNGVFQTATSMWLSVLSARAYLAGGRIQMMMSSGAFGICGISALVAAVAIGGTDGPNIAVSLYNLSMLCSAVLHLAASLSLDRSEAGSRLRDVAFVWVGVLGSVFVFWAGARYDIIPDFILHGDSLTQPRVFTLTLAIAAIASAALRFSTEYRRTRSVFMQAYGAGLGFMAIGLFVVLLSFPGTFAGWLGRFAQYTGNLFFLAAFLSARHEARMSGKTTESVLSELFGSGEAHADRILRSSLNCLYLYDIAKHEFTYVNPSYTRITGYSLDQLRTMDGEAFLGLIHPDDRTPVKAHWEIMLQAGEGETREIEYRFKAADGRWIWCLSWDGVFRRNSVGTPTQIIGSFVDITARRQAEEALRQSEERWAVTLESIGDAVIATDAQGRVTFLNRIAEALTGWTVGEAAGRPVTEVFRIVNEHTRAVVDDPVSRVLKTGMIVGLANHTVLLRKDGGEVPIDDSGAPIRGADGATLGVVLVFRDITARKKAEAAVEESRKSLEWERNLLQAVMDGAKNSHLAFLDRDFNFVRVNEAYARSCGYKPQEMVGKNHFALYPHPENEAIFARVRDTGTAVEFRDKPFAFPDQPERGTTYWDWTLTATKGEDGHVVGLIFSLFETTERVRADTALRASESRYRELVQNANSAIVRWTGDGKITFFNEYAEAFFGWNRGEILGKHVGILVPERESTGGDLTGLVNDIVAHPERYQNNMNENVCRDGRRVWMTWTNRAIRNERGEVEEILAVGSDITARKQAEEALRQSQQRWAVTLASIGDAVIASDADGRVVFLNPVAETLTGWSLKDAAGKPVQEVFRIVNEQTRAVVDDPVSKVLRTGMTVGLANHTVLLRRTGGEVPIDDSGAPIRDEDGRILGVVLVFRDITERYKAEKALSLSERRARLLSDTAAQLLASDHPQRVIEDLAQKVMDHLDCQVSFNFLVDDTSERLRLNTAIGVSEESKRAYETLDFGSAVCGCVARDKQPIVVCDIQKIIDPRTKVVRSYGVQAYCCHPLVAQGKVIGTLSFGTKTRPHFTPDEVELMRTITDQVAIAVQRVMAKDILERTIEERTSKLVLANNELETRAKQLQRLAGELAIAEQRERKRIAQLLHDGIQQNLAAAKLQLGGLVRNPQDSDPTAVESAEQMIAEAIQMSRSLSTDLCPPVLYERGLAAALEWLPRMMRERHGFNVEHSITVQPDFPEPVRVTLFESAKELLFNSVKHSGVKKAELTMLAENGRVQITVSDSGAGFDPSSLKEIGGNGGAFGLFSIQERLALLGGELAVESRPSGGSRFTLSLPYHPSDSTARKAEAKKQPVDFIRVLLVDDHALFRLGLERLCKREPDIKVVGHAENGLEALDQVHYTRPDIILMDVNMPVMGGVEATAAIRAKFPDVRIIGLSMYEDELSIQAMRQAGAVDYKSKSCAASELIAAIRACKQERRTRAASEVNLPSAGRPE